MDLSVSHQEPIVNFLVIIELRICGFSIRGKLLERI